MAMIGFRDFICSDRVDNIWKPDIFEVKKKKTSILCCDDIACFDIEVCNFFVSPWGAVYSISDIFKMCNNDVKKIEECFAEFKPGALPYIWQFSINDWIMYGRALPDFKYLLAYIQNKLNGAELHIWIHNISYEYQFLREILPFTDKFFTEARKPLNLKMDNITFRCS